MTRVASGAANWRDDETSDLRLGTFRIKDETNAIAFTPCASLYLMKRLGGKGGRETGEGARRGADRRRAEAKEHGAAAPLAPPARRHAQSSSYLDVERY